MSTTTDATTQCDNPSGTAPHGTEALDALLVDHGDRICELELELEEQLDDLAASLEAGLHTVERREMELNRESELIDARLQELARRDAETRQQRKKIARDLRGRKAELANREAPASEAEGAAAPSNPSESEFELAFLREELASRQSAAEEAQSRIAELEMQLSQAGSDDGDVGAREADDLRQRLELALEDIRDLKEENRNLLANAERPSYSAPTEGLDWEAQKARMLVQLEGESERDDAGGMSPDQRQRIQELERVLAEREEELCNLQVQLRQPDAPVCEVAPAVNDTERDNLLDSDQLIQEEREKLIGVQNEWREKLRASEIEISVERAKLARERSQLEEQLQVLKQERDQLAANPEGRSAGKKEDKKTAQGRWLARLGLSDQ